LQLAFFSAGNTATATAPMTNAMIVMTTMISTRLMPACRHTRRLK